MRIGINALAMRTAGHGVGTYLSNLISALSKANTPHEYVIFLHDENRERLPPLGSQFTSVSAPANRALRITWEQTGLPAAVKRCRLDLLHGGTFSLPWRKSCAQVVTIHDLTFLLLPEAHTIVKRLYFGRMIPHACRQADRIIAVSDWTKRDIMSALAIPSEKIAVVHHGIDPDVFSPAVDAVARQRVRTKYKLPARFILSLCLIEPRKNLKTLAEAYRRLPEIHGQVGLVLAGSLGWNYAELLRHIEQLRLPIVLPGHIAHEDLSTVYSLADVFVYPSRYEGFGLPVLEAMACGTPVITSNTSSLPEIGGDAAIFVSPDDAASLAEAMRRLLEDGPTRVRLSELGRERARGFTWLKTGLRTVSVYEQAAAAYETRLQPRPTGPE